MRSSPADLATAQERRHRGITALVRPGGEAGADAAD